MQKSCNKENQEISAEFLADFLGYSFIACLPFSKIPKYCFFTYYFFFSTYYLCHVTQHMHSRVYHFYNFLNLSPNIHLTHTTSHPPPPKAPTHTHTHTHTCTLVQTQLLTPPLCPKYMLQILAHSCSDLLHVF